MRQWLLGSLFCIVQLALLSAATAENLQPIPPLTGPVIDLTGTLSASQQEQLSQKLLSFRQKYSAQMQVLIIPTSAPEDAFTYSMRVVDQWKLGDAKKDDGLLLFIALNDHRSQIQVGYGLEGVIPDVIANRLLNDVMAPYFKQGDFYGGINAVIDGIYQRISGEVTADQQNHSNSVNKDDTQGLIIFAIIILGIIAIKIFKSLMGGFIASLAGAPIIFVIVWVLVGLPVMMVFVIVFATLFLAWIPNDVWFLMLLSGRNGGGYGGGGFGGGGSWSGGGGGFGGGGSGGSW